MEEEDAVGSSTLFGMVDTSEQNEPHNVKNTEISEKVEEGYVEGEIVTEEQQTTLVAAASSHDILEQTGSDQTIDEFFVAQSSVFGEGADDPARGSEKIDNEVFNSSAPCITEKSNVEFNTKGDNLTMSDVDDTCYSSDSAMNTVNADFVGAETSGRNQFTTEPASEHVQKSFVESNSSADEFKDNPLKEDLVSNPTNKIESSAAFLESFPFADHEEADQPNQNDEVETPHENPRITNALSTDSGDHDGLDTFAAAEHSTPASIKWMEPTGASLKIEVEDERVAVHVPFTPKKSPYTPSSFKGAPSFDSNTATPLARVLPLISSPPHSAPHSSRHQSNARNSPDPVHFPDIHNTRASFAQSSKVTPSRPASVDPNTTSRSQSMKVSYSAGASFSQPEGSPLFNLDATLSPTAKFRSFIKSIQSGKSGTEEESGAGEDTFGVAGSGKVASGNSAKEVNARIAKIQAEQERFRMTEKLRKSMLGIGRRISFENSNTSSSSDLTGRKLPVKTQKRGVAQNFNANSIRAGLRRHEFRETIQIGNEIVRRKVLPQDPEPQDANLQKACQDLEDVQDGEKEEESHEKEKEQNATPFGIRLAHLYKPAPVTRTGEGYMSEADWKITVKGRSRSPKKSLKCVILHPVKRAFRKHNRITTKKWLIRTGLC